MIKRILKHLESRRKWNRTRRFLRDRATSRLLTGLLASGALSKRA